MPEVRLIDANALKKAFCDWCDSSDSANSDIVCGKSCATLDLFDSMPTIEAEPVRHGRWIECDYKHMEHGMIETEPKAGLCCSECRTGFQKKKMTYKQYCPACGAKMYADGGTISKERFAEIMRGDDDGS